MSRPSLDEYYLGLLPHVASRGTCPRRQVACVLVDARGRLAATGYNGNAPGLPHCAEAPCPGSEAVGGPRELCEAVHAEAAAVLQARDSRREARTAYCSLTPCFDCAKLLHSAGVARVVALRRYRHDDRGVRYLAKAGVELEVVES